MNIANAPLDARPHFLTAFEAARRAARVDLMTTAAVAYGGVRPAWLEYGDLRGLAMLEEVAPMVPADDIATRARLAIRVAAWHQLDPGNETKAHLLTRSS